MPVIGKAMHRDLRVLVLSRFDRLGASSRMRILQFLPYFGGAGIEADVRPFFGAGYLDRLYATGKRRLRDAIPGYLKRFGAVVASKHYSVVWVEKEIFPFMPAVFETILRRFRVPYIVDYDDATFHTYDLHPWVMVRKLFRDRLDLLIEGAHCVTVGNNYLGDYAESHGAKRVELIPTVVDANRYRVVEEPPSRELRIGWVGSPATTKYLYTVRDVLRRLSMDRPVKLVTVGASTLQDFGVPLEQHAWSESTEAQLLESIHVGIMPLPDTPWERGKCGYKLIQYMACGRPVVGSAVGVNQDIVTSSVGYLAEGDDQWLHALRVFADDPKRRHECGWKGRELVEARYSLSAVAPKLVSLVKELVNSL